mmetsp:Transcript_18427/g.24329  ORF Transcript_18427/g.24329 Transcript_18427/m.24329 type:complete len:332 (+) Transcript_18427:62-1057(+)
MGNLLGTNQDFLQRKFEHEDLVKETKSSVKTLVMGMGGGCDVFTAYTLARKLHGDLAEGASETGGAGDILYANCVSERKMASDHVTILPNCLYAVPRGAPRPLQKGENTYGTTLLEQSVPRGAEDSPLLIIVKGHKHVKTEEDLEEMTQENVRRMHAAWERMGVDLILAVDTGGDSLTGGKDYSVSKISGRDQQVLNALREYKKQNENFDFIHIVLGPGCDAETSEETMIQEVWRPTDEAELPWCSGRRYLGAFKMEDMIKATFEMTGILEPNRTPNLMYRALMNNEEYHIDRPELDNEEEGRDLVKIERHNNFEVVPRKWLYHGLAFKYP